MRTLNPAVEIIREQGREQGIEQGREQGIAQEKQSVAFRMHEKGLDYTTIADSIGWNTRRVQQLFVAY